MTIDISALRRFQEVWEPVIQAIPAVLDMAERQADLERGLNIRKLELEKAGSEIAAAYEEADKKLAVVNQELDNAVQAKNEALQEASEIRSKAQADAAEIERAKRASLSALDEQISKVKTELSNLNSDFAARRAAAQAAHSAMVKSLAGEIEDLQLRKQAAEQALAEIKAKLG